MLRKAENKPPLGNTLEPISLDYTKYRAKTFPEVVDALYEDLECVKKKRFDYYNFKRSQDARWANRSKAWLSALGAIAVLLTSAAAVVRVLYGSNPPSPAYDVWLFVGALAIYAIIAAVSFYETNSDRTSSYFRYLMILLAIRDLWTKASFAILSEAVVVYTPKSQEEKDAIQRVIDLGIAFTTDLDKLATEELGEWKTEHLLSLSELEAAAQKGTAEVTGSLKAAVRDLEKAAKENLKAAVEAANAQKAAIVNFVVEGEFTGNVSVQASGRQVYASHLKNFSVDDLAPGLAKIEAMAQSPAGDPLAASFIVELKPGLQDVKIELT
ncbi:hypothetical protein [Ruegeria lacuscaerulensis]|uniref:hypothetical protein n=1 Tax=Ruegeria lacuscaerulensis TaxID=55218 RepID=UPI00147AD0CD|nr:hypothetical protein [Ruegeria lacuscaerulensis]